MAASGHGQLDSIRRGEGALCVKASKSTIRRRYKYVYVHVTQQRPSN